MANTEIEKGAYTYKELANMTGYSVRTVGRIFDKEPGLIRLNHPEEMHKRSYCSKRVPKQVYERVLKRLTTM